MKNFCILGSGIAGSTIANLLTKKYSVEIFDKARGPGGRAANRKFKGNLSFDHGLQYLSPKSKKFKEFILQLKKKGVLKEWTGNHLNYNFSKKKDTIKYIGVRGNNDICKYLLKNIKVNYNSTITNIKFNSNYWTITLNNKNQIFFRYLIITCPFPQLKQLAAKYIEKNIPSYEIKMLPNITVMAVYKNYKKLPINSIKFNDRILHSAVQENTKNRFNSNQILWTVQCTEIFSKKIINLFKNNKNKYQMIVLKKFENLLGYQTKNIIFKSIHGWKYSYSKTNSKLDCLWVDKKRLGVCADWFNGPYAEDAWFSAKKLYLRIKKSR